ncbi:hypothetical protein F2Q69_00024426 [Brassica cretica]|uniref:Uncharacterized protein n=1 Tax=Brassica cretica TaxID=69181 RepID=A0A8S9Q574_BRACR|nr:hypothetical protein F2Q69_00024426 [Brassica cretica]
MGTGEAVSQVTRCQQLTDPYACHRHCSTVSPLYDTASRLQGETAQNIVFQALRHAAVTETVVRHFSRPLCLPPSLFNRLTTLRHRFKAAGRDGSEYSFSGIETRCGH